MMESSLSTFRSTPEGELGTGFAGFATLPEFCLLGSLLMALGWSALGAWL